MSFSVATDTTVDVQSADVPYYVPPRDLWEVCRMFAGCWKLRGFNMAGEQNKMHHMFIATMLFSFRDTVKTNSYTVVRQNIE